MPWSDPVDPLFIDTNYSHPSSPMSQWQLQVDHVELTPVSNQATPPVDAQTPSYDDRSLVKTTIAQVLGSAMLTREMLDPQGQIKPRHKIGKNDLTEAIFQKMNVISAPLTAVDTQLFADDFRLRAGVLRLNRLDLVDIFGFARPWQAPDPSVDNPNSPWLTPLPPRLPYWSRLHFRLMSADDPNVEASAIAPPALGILLPDFLEHALEVFDGTGTGIGQLTTDRPIRGQTGAVTQQVTFKVHPWLPQPANPFDAIANPKLRALIESIVAQSNAVPAGNAGWEETGLSAMLRVIDTIRGTLDPSAKTPDRKVSLIGEPIVVYGARLQFQGTATDTVAELAGEPPLLSAPPQLPSIPVRIGDITRPDDGVLGCFIAGATPADGRFAPVTKEAAEKAIVNALAAGFPLGFATGMAAKHPFVKDVESLFTLAPDQPLDVIILTDVRGGIYATCGALPRKKIQMPREFIDAAVKKLEPSFYTGPILASQLIDYERALLPPPEVPGYTAEFLHQKPGEQTFNSSEVPAAPPLSELPKQRVLLTEGWLRMVPVKV
jgi:hypothetical protein